MSFYSDASLVLIPSGYKDQKIYSAKPTDGLGDLVFSRASNATRVASNGLIEKVRTNLLLQSNTFSTTWFNINSTETSGQAGYDGTNNAWQIDLTGAAGYISQSIANSGVATASIYAKAGTLNFVRARVTGSGFDKLVDVDLTDGSIDTTGAGNINATATSVGSGWYRITLTFDSSTSALLIYPIQAANDFTATSGNILIQNAQLEAGDIATDYIATTTAAVSVGPVSGLPRLDYLNSTCPRLLLEPQRTNLVFFSEQFDNAYHTKNQASVTANAATSPDGYTNADKLIPNTTSTDDHRLSGGTLTVVSGSAYTTSVFVKNGGYNVVSVRSAAGKTVQVNLTTGVAIAYGSPTATSVVNYGNGWYRISITDNASSTSYSPAILVQNTTASQYPIWAGNGTDGILIYGFQVELGAYPSSYLPTLSTSVTRVADDMNTTFASAITTDGGATFFIQLDGAPISAVNSNVKNFSLDFASGDYITYNHGSTSAHRIRVDASGTAYYSTAGVSTILQDEPVKMAASVTASSVVMYVNGVEALNTSLTGNWNSATSLTTIINDSIGIIPLKQWIVFPTALTATQLAELTA
jgi:hypothetical protein